MTNIEEVGQALNLDMKMCSYDPINVNKSAIIQLSWDLHPIIVIKILCIMQYNMNIQFLVSSTGVIPWEAGGLGQETTFWLRFSKYFYILFYHFFIFNILNYGPFLGIPCMQLAKTLMERFLSGMGFSGRKLFLPGHLFSEESERNWNKVKDTTKILNVLYTVLLMFDINSISNR